MITRRRFLTALGTAASYPLLSGFIPMVPEVARPGAVKPAGKGETRVNVMAVGDLMMHGSNLKYAYDPKTGRYDFSPYFQYVKPVFNQADWVIGNLEPRLAGIKARYTGYPMFNAPERLALDLKQTGFTLLATANNHCLDRRSDGVIRTNETLDYAGLLHTGTFVSNEDHDTVRVLSKNNLTMAVFAYTYGTNGVPVPKEQKYLVNLIDYERMAEDVARARKLGVDFIACVLHFGVEYIRHPDQTQIRTVEKLFDMGVDLVFGSHPHVVQPYQVMEKDGKKRAVIYSMGNFIGGQRGIYRNIGVIFKVVLSKTADGEKKIAAVESMPTRIVRVVSKGRSSYRVLPIQWMLDHRKDYMLPERLLAELQQQLVGMDKHLRSMMT